MALKSIYNRPRLSEGVFKSAARKRAEASAKAIVERVTKSGGTGALQTLVRTAHAATIDRAHEHPPAHQRSPDADD